MASEPRSHPILFSGEMVRALLEGRKTQTRRCVRSNTGKVRPDLVHRAPDAQGEHWCEPGGWVRCPFGAPGDTLWVRETWATDESPDGIEYRADHAFLSIANTPEAAEAWVVAHDNGRHGERWRPSIFMPRWASRITLRVTDVRVQRLREISEGDAKAEGLAVPTIGGESYSCLGWDGTSWSQHDAPAVSPAPIAEALGLGCKAFAETQARTCGTASGAFSLIWDIINGKRPGCAWDDNPWVWAISFDVRR